ncbi:hypothetical protein LSAT2_021101 [Lamellibrachia satsuma]|nr:hypothetical protein LSAT2_021101 [Lamellibrachia satsuma]
MIKSEMCTYQMQVKRTPEYNILHESIGKSESSENLPPTSLPVKLDECVPLATTLDSNIPKADPQTSHSSKTKTLFHPGTPCAAFDKVVQENLRLKKLCKELTSSNGTNKTISLDNQEYDEIITKLKQEVTQVKLELQDTRISLIMKDNGNKDALAVKLVELQKEKAKLSKSVVAKTYLLSIYNKEYERLKQAHIQLQQQVSQKNKVNTDTGTSAERQPGDGVETPDDTLRPEVQDQLTVLQTRHTQEIERLQKEKQSLLQKNVKLQLLNKTYAESIEELSRTRRTVDEQPMSMADMRKEMDTLRDDNDMYAHEIKRYSKKMDEMELEMKATEKTKDTERLKQKEFCDKQVTQLQEQYTKLSKENLELQRKLDDVAKRNKQLQYQLSRSPQTSTESQNSPSLMTVPFVGEGLVVADGVEEEEFICPWCDRKFHDQAKLEVHKKKCMDS